MNKKTPVQKLADWLITRWVEPVAIEEFLGDLHELYEEQLYTKGKFVAEVMYMINAIHLLFGFYSTTRKKQNYNTMVIGNMLKIFWRNALKQKQFSILNVLGLTLGISTTLIIGLYVHDETSYDTFHQNGERIYRVNQPMIWGDWNEQFASTGPGVAEALKTDIADFEEVTRILSIGERTVRITASEKQVVYTEKKIFFADDNFLRVFQFPLEIGNKATLLKNPNALALTTSTAQRYFGSSENAMGKVIEVKQNDGTYIAYTVNGILSDLPARSHLQIDMLGSVSSISDMKDNSWKWIWTGFSTYVLLQPGTNVADLENRIQALPQKWAARTTKDIFNQSFEEFTAGKKWTLYLQPVRNIYLASTPNYHRFGPTGNPQFVMIFGVIGILVLTLSCINFMNLSTARSSGRAKEVGVRKVLGSQKRTLMWQFVIESAMYVAVGTFLSIIVVELSLSAFNSFADRHLTLLPHFTKPFFILGIPAFILILGAAAGSYPAFYLSAFRPAEVLKGKLRAGLRNAGIRNGLVVFQFTVSIALIICTFFVHKQLSYTRNMDVGMMKDNILQLHNVEQLGNNAGVLKEKIRTNPAFEEVALSHSVPPYVWEGDRYRAENSDEVLDLSYMRIDEHYLPLLEAEFIAGRNFDQANASDKYKVIINEEAARILGFGTRDSWENNSPVSKFIVQSFDAEEKFEVIGVVRNFNFNSVRQKILPLLIMHENNDLHWSHGQGRKYLSMRINPASVRDGNDLQLIIDDVKKSMTEIDPSIIFQFSFMNDEFDNSFKAEQKLSVILNVFTSLATIIACLGLFGLSAYSAEQRKKELGIRKLHGASIRGLIFVFSRQFTTLVGIGILLASPIAYFVTDFWLSDFAYRTPINLWVFATAGAGAMTVAILTVGYQSIIAARNNPVDILRSE
ncbi:MAG: ABC transporter permease [Bacteroidota bacterium]